MRTAAEQNCSEANSRLTKDQLWVGFWHPPWQISLAKRQWFFIVGIKSCLLTELPISWELASDHLGNCCYLPELLEHSQGFFGRVNKNLTCRSDFPSTQKITMSWQRWDIAELEIRNILVVPLISQASASYPPPGTRSRIRFVGIKVSRVGRSEANSQLILEVIYESDSGPPVLASLVCRNTGT